jgi:hypothetical protein
VSQLTTHYVVLSPPPEPEISHVLGRSKNCEMHLLVSSCLSLRPSVLPEVCIEQLSSHWTDFHEIWYVVIFRTLSRKFKFHYNRTMQTGTLHEYQYTFFIISRSVLLRMRNVSDKIVEKIKTQILSSITFFSKIVPLTR